MKDNELVKKNYNALKTPMPNYLFFALNTNNPKLSNKKVRRALAYMLDMDEVIETLFYGQVERIVGPIASSEFYFNKAFKAHTL